MLCLWHCLSDFQADLCVIFLFQCFSVSLVYQHTRYDLTACVCSGNLFDRPRCTESPYILHSVSRLRPNKSELSSAELLWSLEPVNTDKVCASLIAISGTPYRQVWVKQMVRGFSFTRGYMRVKQLCLLLLFYPEHRQQREVEGGHLFPFNFRLIIFCLFLFVSLDCE